MIPDHLNPMGCLPYKRKLQYLEATGTQWLSTGIVFDKDHSMTAEAKCAIFSPANYCILGNYSNGSEQSFNFQIGGSNGRSPRAFIKLGSTSASEVAITLSSLSNAAATLLSMQYDAANQTVMLSQNNGTSTSAAVPTGSNTTLRELNVFRDYRSNVFTARFRIYWLKIWKDGNLCFDGIPVMDNRNAVCMFDRVSNAFHYNQGTGTFEYN